MLKAKHFAALRLKQLRDVEKRAASRRAREVTVGAYFQRTRLQAALERRKRAEEAAFERPTFARDARNNGFMGVGGGDGHSARVMFDVAPSHRGSVDGGGWHDEPALRHQGHTRGVGPSPPSKRPPRGGKADGAAETQLTSAQTVRAVLDIFYDKALAEHGALGRSTRPQQRAAPGPPALIDVAKKVVAESGSYGASLDRGDHAASLTSIEIPNGMLGLRIGCAECDPHPTIRLFQRLLGWSSDGHLCAEEHLPRNQRVALWLMWMWMMPSRAQMRHAIEQQLAAMVTSSQRKYKLGAAPVYEPMPPRTTVNFDAVGRAVAMLGKEKRLLESREHADYLMRAARGLYEDRRAEGRAAVVDVEELLLYFTEVWGDWSKYKSVSNVFDVPARALPPRRRVRVDRETLQRQEVQPSRRQAAGVVAEKRAAALGELHAEAQSEKERAAAEGRVAAHTPNPDADVGAPGAAGEEFAAGMRHNGMEFAAADRNRDKKLDFDEFCTFVAQRERGPHSQFELRARFDSLDADKSGQIDLHEFIRFSLRDALARASARVIDLLREWDDDGNGAVDRKEFRRAVQALGFGALADREDVDMVFDEFDESKDGLIQFNELNRMLRQSAAVDARVLGGVEGQKALESERRARLTRASPNARRGVASVLGGGELDAAKAARAAGVVEQLRQLFAASPARMMDLFREIDESGDGLISRRELSLAMRALGLSLPKDELALLFKQLDPDGSNAIEYHELRAVLESVQ